MLKIVQAGEEGKSKYLLDMHRLRKRVFKDRMKWPLPVTIDELEVDQFDLPNTAYLLALDDEERVIGHWRLLPTDGPTMIRDIWPQFLDTIDLPKHPLIWEASRFAVESAKNDDSKGLAQVHRATAELFCGLTEICLLCGIHEIFTLYDMRIARLLRRLNCAPVNISSKIQIDDELAVVGRFITDDHMLQSIRHATGISSPLVTPEMLPPTLQALRLAAMSSVTEAAE